MVSKTLQHFFFFGPCPKCPSPCQFVETILTPQKNPPEWALWLQPEPLSACTPHTHPFKKYRLLYTYTYTYTYAHTHPLRSTGFSTVTARVFKRVYKHTHTHTFFVVKVLSPVSFKNPWNTGIGHQFKTFLTSKAESTHCYVIYQNIFLLSISLRGVN